MKNSETLSSGSPSSKQLAIYPSGIWKLFRYRLRARLIRLASWEYWPMWAVYFPASFYFIFLSIRARSFFFFSAANPSIETGGMFFESKWSIFQLLPKNSFPPTILVNPDLDIHEILNSLKQAAIVFPVIAKPDRGERGWGVKKVNDINELTRYREAVKVPFIIQSYIDSPIELSIFYTRHPSCNKGRITSVTFKKLLSVTGDGRLRVRDLIKQDNRSFLQCSRLQENRGINFDQVLPRGEELVLVPYGNHVRGAMFLNYNHIIDERLTSVIDAISTQIEGFYYGRFDLRCNSIDELKAGKGISILELNGSGAEPAHIYDPSFSYREAQIVISKHYKMMFDAAMENKKRGFSFMNYKDYLRTKRLEKEYKNKIADSWE